MRRHSFALGGASLLLGVSILAAQAQTVTPTTPPDPPKFEAQGTPVFVGVKDIFEYKALPEYHEPDWVKAFVDAGKLPPVAERLPKEPLVYKTAQHARRHRRLWRRHAPRHRRPAGRLELLRRPVPGLGRHRHRHVGVPDPHRRRCSQVKAEELEPLPEPGQELGMVRGRPRADHAPDRGRQVVGRRSVQLRGRRCSTGTTTSSIPTSRR